ncbi:YciI family protein [Amycolatopsis minnesotensis]|uniref:YciI family protein n=1 Tax=Amycolatopsis minnesotensis TaxID=337894 RepID=A0ABP5DD97_9PSEU
MKQYLLSIYQPDGAPPPPEVLDPVMRELDVVNTELRASGNWIFSGGLCPPDTATVVHHDGGETLTTDGPYLEGKEHIGGFTVFQAADLDEALDWGRRFARVLSPLRIEIRPMEFGTC